MSDRPRKGCFVRFPVLNICLVFLTACEAVSVASLLAAVSRSFVRFFFFRGLTAFEYIDSSRNISWTKAVVCCGLRTFFCGVSGIGLGVDSTQHR